MKKINLWRWTFYLTGMLITSLGITMTIKGQSLGISPWDVLHVGLYQNFGLTIGTWGIITGFFIVVTTAIFLRTWPRFGTWLNMVSIGMFIDMFNWLLPEIQSFGGQITIFIFGVFILGYGVGVVISPNIGAGPRDSLMLVIVDKFGFSIKKARVIIEVVVAIIGWTLGGPIGFGTVIIALLSGQIIQYSLPHARGLLLKIIGETDEKVLL